jgi:hypothetical protein
VIPLDKLHEIAILIFSCTGLLKGLELLLNRFLSSRDHKAKMLLGLGHDRIVYLGTQYLKRGYITRDEYENLHDYLYIPYTKLGGNGTAKKVMEEVEELPLKG